MGRPNRYQSLLGLDFAEVLPTHCGNLAVLARAIAATQAERAIAAQLYCGSMRVLTCSACKSNAGINGHNDANISRMKANFCQGSAPTAVGVFSNRSY